VSQVSKWLASGAGIAGGVLVAAGQPVGLGPILVIVGVLGGLPLLLIITLALVAVFSPHRARRGAAEKILTQLLSALTQARQQ
jgi:hypothetical protein